MHVTSNEDFQRIPANGIVHTGNRCREHPEAIDTPTPAPREDFGTPTPPNRKNFATPIPEHREEK